MVGLSNQVGCCCRGPTWLSSRPASKQKRLGGGRARERALRFSAWMGNHGCFIALTITGGLAVGRGDSTPPPPTPKLLPAPGSSAFHYQSALLDFPSGCFHTTWKLELQASFLGRSVGVRPVVSERRFQHPGRGGGALLFRLPAFGFLASPSALPTLLVCVCVCVSSGPLPPLMASCCPS